MQGFLFDVVLIIASVGMTAIAKAMKLVGEAAAQSPPRQKPDPITFDEVADVSVRVTIQEDDVMRFEAHALVPGGPRFDRRPGERLAADESLPAHVRDHLREDLPHAEIASDGRVITLHDAYLAGRDRDAAVVVVAELARRGMDAIHALRELPGGVYDPPRGPWEARTPPRVRLPGHDVTFELRARAGGGASVIAWTEIGAAAPAVVPPPLVHEGARLVHVFDGVETDAQRLLAAAETLRFAAASARAGRYG